MDDSFESLQGKDTLDYSSPWLLKRAVGGIDKVPTGTCPECEADVHVDNDADKGDVISCEECGTDLEVVGLDPVELDIVEDDDADSEEEDDEEF